MGTKISTQLYGATRLKDTQNRTHDRKPRYMLHTEAGDFPIKQELALAFEENGYGDLIPADGTGLSVTLKFTTAGRVTAIHEAQDQQSAHT